MRIHKSKNRRGAATVEFAVMLPLIVLLVLGSIECSGLMFAKQAMVQSAYEAALVASKVDGKNVDAVDAAQRVARGRRINNLTLTFSPSDTDNAAPGTIITVTAAAPANSNRYISSNLLRVNNVTAQAVMVKE
ncbi:MAG: TadE/TadG family type IV pilus assembly protein [Pirellulaceae bacterium]